MDRAWLERAEHPPAEWLWVAARAQFEEALESGYGTTPGGGRLRGS